ncbi:hypothetical protein KW95_04350 [Clostridioides difficile]|nr:hypothetical protein KW95_04350 [Clostridioides difficile]
MKANCIGILYEKGDYYTSKRVSDGSKVKIKGDYIQIPQGNGWAKNLKASKLILKVEINGSLHDIWIDQYFKDNIGRLTKNRRANIIDSMPSVVEVDEFNRQDSSPYYVVKYEELEAWASRVRIKEGC